jgi:hypothetical protein
LNSPYRGFPKGDLCETHRFSFCRSILFVCIFRRPTGSGTGIVDQSLNAARIEASSEATPLQKTQRQTPARLAQANNVITPKPSANWGCKIAGDLPQAGEQSKR